MDPELFPPPARGQRVASAFRRRLANVSMLAPFRIHDFKLLWTAASISLLGDGIYLVAIAWQVYDLSNAPSALAFVGVAWTLPQVVCLFAGGVISDRFERRKVLIGADLARSAAVGGIAVVSLAGGLQLWHVVALVAVYGAAEGFFAPAFGGIVPDIVDEDLLVQANALDQFMRPFALRMIGPALGGWAVGVLGPGGGLLLDAGSFAVSALVLTRLRRRAPAAEGGASRASLVHDVGEGLTFVRARPWLWATLAASTVALLATWGPIDVLVPYLVRNALDGGPAALGLVFSAGGIGSIAAAIALGQRGLPRRRMPFLYLAWAGAGAVVAGYGVAGTVWQAAAIAFMNGLLLTAGLIVWTTLLQTLVPRELLGRVMSIDWIVSYGLVPISFAVTGPTAAAFGVRTTLIVGGAVAAIPFLACLAFLPAARDPRPTSAGRSVRRGGR